MHALIIEDNGIISLMIEDELRDLGYTSFSIATNQSEAVRLAAVTCPDLITADDKLSEGSGIEAVRQICAHMAVAVVFITANLDRVDIPNAVRLAKPFRASDLREAVQVAIATARAYA